VSNNLRDEVIRLHAHVGSGLADPVRILILYSLAENKFNVTDLANTLEIPQPTISRHLKVLRERNMVSATREAQSVYYNITDNRIIEALDLLRGVLADNLESQGQLAQSVSSQIKTEETEEE
jgi:DNA-binding transcriptional ArsR family regulator